MCVAVALRPLLAVAVVAVWSAGAAGAGADAARAGLLARSKAMAVSGAAGGAAGSRLLPDEVPEQAPSAYSTERAPRSPPAASNPRPGNQGHAIDHYLGDTADVVKDITGEAKASTHFAGAGCREVCAKCQVVAVVDGGGCACGARCLTGTDKTKCKKMPTGWSIGSQGDVPESWEASCDIGGRECEQCLNQAEITEEIKACKFNSMCLRAVKEKYSIPPGNKYFCSRKELGGCDEFAYDVSTIKGEGWTCFTSQSLCKGSKILKLDVRDTEEKVPTAPISPHAGLPSPCVWCRTER